jgi:uncharacterized membrane protein SirB2
VKQVLRRSAKVCVIVCVTLLALNIICMLLLACFDHYANHHEFSSSVPRMVTDTILLILGFLLSWFAYQITPRQQNLWVVSGSESRPSV